MSLYKLVIVEDNPMIAMLNRTYAQRDGRFCVCAEFPDGSAALPWLLTHPADLVLLDVYMPVFSGLDLLRELRAKGSGVDVVMVTAAHEVETLDALMKLGITDYLVKPFTEERFRQALDSFCHRREALGSLGRVCQADIDQLLRPQEAPPPKGLQSATLDRLRAALKETGSGEATCEDLASRTGLSVVTARRYVSYLVQAGEATARMNYDTGGRPCLVYRAK